MFLRFRQYPLVYLQWQKHIDDTVLSPQYLDEQHGKFNVQTMVPWRLRQHINRVDKCLHEKQQRCQQWLNPMEPLPHPEPPPAWTHGWSWEHKPKWKYELIDDDDDNDNDDDNGNVDNVTDVFIQMKRAETHFKEMMKVSEPLHDMKRPAVPKVYIHLSV